MKPDCKILKNIIFFYLFLLTSVSFAQGKIAWTQKPFEQKVFVENKGQFDGVIDEDVKYCARNGGVDIYFHNHGIVWEYADVVYEKHEDTSDKREERENAKVESKFLYMNWIGVNPNAKIKKGKQLDFYYTYGTENNSGKTITASAYDEITYTDLYPGIDVVYRISEGEKTGFKYTIIVHPGADVSLIRMRYDNAESVEKDDLGNIIAKSSFGPVIDHAPELIESGGKNITADGAFVLNNNDVSIQLQEYDNSEALIIDPWTSNPSFPTNKAYDINYDLNGNVFVYGSYSPYQVAKFNSSGTLQWTYSAVALSGIYYGDFAVDEGSGSSYLFEAFAGTGAKIIKLNSAGTQVGSWNGNPNFREMWRADYNRCIDKIIVGGGGTSVPSYQAVEVDTNLTTMTPVNVLSTNEAYHDVALFTIDNNSNYCYMLFAYNLVSTNFNNSIVKCPIPGLVPITYMVPGNHTFQEAYSVTYVPTAANGMNGMACSSDYLYTYDGSVIKKWNKNTGAFISSSNLSSTLFSWGGLTVEECDTIYVGVQNTIQILDSALSQVGSFSASGTVYDLKYGPGNKLYACGNGFVSEIDLPANNVGVTISSTTATTCDSCDGTASVSATSCGNASSFSYLWSDGQTTQIATGLCAGLYTVTVTTNCNVLLGTDTVTIATGNSNFSINLTTTDLLCAGDTDGTADVTVSGTATPYTYYWSNGQTNQSITGLSGGTYTITVTDSSGCDQIETFIINEPQQLVINISDYTDLLCNGDNNGTATISVSGGTPGYNYTWSSGGTDSTAVSLSAGVYVVTVTDNNGCTQVTSVTLTEPSAMSITDSSSEALCITPSGSATVTVNGGTSPYSFLWENGQTAQTDTSLTAGNYTVTVTDNNGCTEVHVVTVGVYSDLHALFEANPDNGLAPLIVNFINQTYGGTAPYVWDWDFENGNSSSEFEPSQTYDAMGTYTVTLNVVDDNGCKDEYQLTIVVDVISSLVIPNVFTPNNDGFNDYFNIQTQQISEFHCDIYNRWGEKIYEWDNHPADAWDGENHPDGTYYYILNAEGMDGKKYEETGYVTVIRGGKK